MCEKKELELYVHIPFCVRKCAYCDFLSAPADTQERTLYIDALTEEIRARKNDFTAYRVSTIFLGGGTPSILEGGDSARIFRALQENFDISDDAEITMEVNPGTVTEEKAASWRKSGVNRLSIGLQSADDRELKMLGRIHTYREFLDTWKIVREAGFENVNVDLISATPGQNLRSWSETLRKAADLGPEHISAYSLIVEEGTPFYERYGDGSGEDEDKGNHLPPLPDEDTEREIYKATEKILAEYGYHRYEISNYAKTGYECRHNLGYWERKEYLGLGLGASSLISECRFHNTADMGKYLRLYENAGTDICEDIEHLSVEDQMEEFMFLGLRKTVGISVDDFRKAFGKEIREVYGEQMRKLEEQRLIEYSGNRVRLTERGTDISNYVFSEFMF
ncbi:oxygen-independent coproporphyrinogen III oxidase [Mediterraneibacter glycyrrhizinilyticus]|uniref:radical SAM family heme chaperone HemW n=1 Tax=Mediterraneibacter glycyrrhizinilyticus TaxID=342942 RepID=UPI002658549C|nr:radical SAM family heme chaperone HemW [Mediterraneibacter glycyrrhizinilyticus]MCF2569753.1 oxygen-independent coproporphyrinogen III oxidase [Mediterraneibacter glycyrrhizinilyticus]